ncbi:MULTISPECIES: L-rhamnose mutarotase [Proteiniphilum]|uniref:L-rhamnose mutarotase n=1 Tax=Proteiniphilum TaxID=294702 RepID=UPI0003772761|nr:MULTISPECIES: L-rhamnose mutarotase [Proteiniphilum]RNC65949.1 L-rhamnose mutarotase [Proteiniphilum sp. X52]
MEKAKGYTQKNHTIPTKRYCQTLELKDNPELIREYILLHSEAYHWPEIREGIRSVGILEMEIYFYNTTLFMIVETPLDFDWEVAFTKLAELPRQAEWEKYMSGFQETSCDDDLSKKWKKMERLFHLYE